MGNFLTFLRAFALEPIIWLLLLGLYTIHLGASGLGSPMEAFYLQSAKETLLQLQGQWSPLFFNHHTLYWEPPLFPWLSALSLKIFGLHLWAGRLPALLGGMLAILLTYTVSLLLFSNRITALITATLLAVTWGYFQASHLATPVTLTATLLLGSFWAFHTWFPLADRAKLFLQEKQLLSFLQGSILGLLFLTVGWLGVVIPVLSYGLYLILSGSLDRLLGCSWVSFLLGLSLIALPWPIWLALQSGDTSVFWQFVTHIPITGIGLHAASIVGNLMYLFLAFLPASMFLVPMITDYRTGSRLLSRQENTAGFLSIMALVSLLAFLVMGAKGLEVLGSFVLIPTILLVGHYLGWVMETGEQSKVFNLTTDALVVLLVFSAVILTFFIFQTLPDNYSDGFWSLPGPPVLSKLWLGKEITLPNLFPIWKLWLLPGPLILLGGGVLLYFLGVTQRTHQVPVAVVATTLCFLLFIRLAFLPIFQRPLFEDFAQQLDKRRTSHDTVLLVYNAVPQVVQTLFFLKTMPTAPVYVTNHIQQLRPKQLQPTPGKHLYGVMSETDYYQLPPESRQQLHILSHNWIWTLPSPLKRTGKNRHSDTTPYQEEILLFEAMPTLPTSPEMPTPFLHNSSL